MKRGKEGFLVDFIQFSNKYEDQKIAKENKDIKRNSQIAGMAAFAQSQIQQDELIRLCNRREKYDENGNCIPQAPAYEASSTYVELARDAGISWMCDKCMAMNFGSQRICAECGDKKDEKDERLGRI